MTKSPVSTGKLPNQAAKRMARTRETVNRSAEQLEKSQAVFKTAEELCHLSLL